MTCARAASARPAWLKSGHHAEHEESAQHEAQRLARPAPGIPGRRRRALAPLCCRPLRHYRRPTSDPAPARPAIAASLLGLADYQSRITPADHHSPIMRTSASRATPLCSLTRFRASSISARTSSARAPPRLTIKFACWSENAAPPAACPLSPAFSSSRPAKVAGRILENRTRIRQPARLARGALGLELRDARAQLLAIAVLELEIHPRDHEARRQLGAAIGELDLRAGQRDRLALVRRRRAPAVTTRAISPPNAPAFITRPPPTLPGIPSPNSSPARPRSTASVNQRAELRGRTRADLHVVELQAREALAEVDDQSAHAAIADQQIGARAQAKCRHPRAPRRRHRSAQFVFALDREQDSRRARRSETR